MSYTVTLDPGSGSTPNESLEVEILRDPPAATRSYNLLQGWFDSETGGNEIAFPYVPSADVTLYARWLPEYLVSFSTNGGSSISSITADYIPEQPESTKSNYSLSGWSTSSDGSELIVFPYEVPEAITLYAVWDVEELPQTTTYYDQTPNVSLQAAENKKVDLALTKLQQPHLTGLKLNADVEINGLTLNTIDDNDVVWVVTDIDGWWTLPESELPDLPRGWGDGSYDSIGRWSNRIITLTGSFLPQRPEDAPAARNALIEAISLIKTGGWLIVYEDKTTNPSANGKAAYVRLSGVPQIQSISARGRHDFSIGLKAVDPIKYEYVDGNADGYNYIDLTATTLGDNGYDVESSPIVNSGNVPVPIVLEISSVGSIPDSDNLPTIANDASDQTMTLVDTIATSHKLEVDTYNREALDVEYSGSTVVDVANGRAKLSVLIDWIYLEPGENTISLTNFPQNATCRVLWRSGWIG